jgi:hypothetical protein
MSAERLWSDWICELFPDLKVRFRQWSITDATHKVWDAPMGLTAKVVCKVCNEGWMSDLESGHAKSAMKSLILSNDPVILDTARGLAQPHPNTIRDAPPLAVSRGAAPNPPLMFTDFLALPKYIVGGNFPRFYKARPLVTYPHPRCDI